MDRPGITGRVASRVASRVALCAAAVLVPVTLAACGSTTGPGATGAASTRPSPSASASPSPSPSPSSSSAAATQAVLCQDTSAVTGLVIVRAVVRVPQGLQLAFPHQVTVATAAQARAVARALCALPRLPSGVINCPALLVGTTYQLRFTADGRQLPAVTIESTGCEVVTGVGLARRASTSPGFWRVLATAANLSPPGRSVFSGNSRDPICPPPPGQPDEHNGCPATLQPGGVAVP
jgi:hypothetical protein